MRFVKMHGAGNDYIYIDARRLTERDWGDIARRISDRHFGVGSDGLILVLPSKKADIRMRMFNSDGSEAEMCGNGVRCFAKLVIEEGMAKPKGDILAVETLAGIIKIQPSWDRGTITGARVNMGTPRLKPVDIPVNVKDDGPVIDYTLALEEHTFKLTFVSMGNPHAVAFIEEPVREFPLHVVGPKMEHHPLYPRRVNFEIVNVHSSEHLQARVWERGSGETLACATGACAITVAAHLKGLVNDKVQLTMPGGMLSIQWPGQGDVCLEGPAERVFEGEWKDR